MITIICNNFGNSTIYIEPGRQSETKTGIQKNLATTSQKFQKILFMASSWTYYVPKCGSTRLCDQTAAYSLQTDTHTHTHGQTKILSNDIFYFRTVIIGGPIDREILKKYRKGAIT